ncbi:MAG TPA: ethanolamine ammonia-lyase reactivating factor EutA, partial [Chloroflexota bacterium]|nr:ethanolamine ammonia-lyase reactivating factor EutA [Chloroflexota bacterium]
YGAAMRLGKALSEAIVGLPLPLGIVLVFEHNVARTVGAALAKAGSPAPFMCLDELEVGDLDYLDVGEAIQGEDYLPVVVKSLVFSGPAQPGHSHHH